MDNYVKGEEKDIESSIPFDEDVILNVPVLKVKTNTKVHNLCGYAEKLLAVNYLINFYLLKYTFYQRFM